MRRLFLVFSEVFATHGGIQRFNRLLCRALDELSPSLGLDIHAFSMDAAVEGAGTLRAPLSFPFDACDGQASLARRVLAAAARRRPDGLIVGHVGMTPVGLVCTPFLSRGYACVVHGEEAWKIPRWSRRLGARRARVVLSVSRFTGRELCREARVDPARVRLLPNTIDPEMGGVDTGEARPAAPDGFELLSVARLDAREGRKGIDHAIAAVAALSARHPSLRMRVVGSGDDARRLQDLARGAGLVDRVRFEHGLSDADLAQRYRQCDAFVLPSSQEGFGIVFLEAMRFGKPCIGSPEGGIPEVIEDGVTGSLVPFGEVSSLARAIETLVVHPEARLRMGEAGRKRFHETFAYPRFRERVEAHVREWLP